MTNREWLESLNDEEFVEEINNRFDCDECELFMKCNTVFCNERFVKWLQAEHGEKEVEDGIF